MFWIQIFKQVSNDMASYKDKPQSGKYRIMNIFLTFWYLLLTFEEIQG